MEKRRPRVGFMVATSHSGLIDELGKPFPVMGMAEKAQRKLVELGYETIELVDEGLIIGKIKGDQVDDYNKDAVVDTREKALKAIEKFKDKDVDCLVIFLPTWFWANLYTQALLELNKPILSWAGDDIAGCQGIGLWAMRGTLDAIGGFIHKEVYGKPDDEQAIRKIKSFIEASMVKNILRKSIYGQFGSMPMGMIPGLLEDIEWLRKFGIQAEHLESLLLVVVGEKFSDNELREAYNTIKGRVNSIQTFDNEFIKKNLRIYLAHKKLINDYGLDFDGVKCTMELSDNYCSPCIAQSMLLSEGYITGCTTEPKGSLMMYIMRILSDSTIFQGDIEQVERKTSIARMASCGSAPIDFAETKEDYNLVKGPDLEGEAGGICIDVIGKSGKVTFGRIARVDNEYVMQITTGEVIREENVAKYREKLGFPRLPFATIKLSGDVEKFIDNLRSQYMHICYDNLVDKLVEVCNVLKIRPIVC